MTDAQQILHDALRANRGEQVCLPKIQTLAREVLPDRLAEIVVYCAKFK